MEPLSPKEQQEVEVKLIKKIKKIRNKKPDLESKIGKYFIARKQGKTGREAQEIAGYAVPTHADQIEKSRTFQELEKVYYKDEVLKKLTMSQIADEHIKNIIQDEDKGAKNKAIEMALNRIEPDTASREDNDKVLVILKG